MALPFAAMAIEARPTGEPVVAGAADGRNLTVLYDADCGVCRETIRHLRKWDRERRLEFLPLQTAARCGRPNIAAVAARDALADAVHVVEESTGRVVPGGPAALAVIRALPGGWILRPWTSLPSTTLAADVVYRVASRHLDRLAWFTGMPNEVPCPLDGARAHTVVEPAIESRQSHRHVSYDPSR